MHAVAIWPVRVVAGHRRLMAALLSGVASYPLLPRHLGDGTRAVLAWNIGALVMLILVVVLFALEGDDEEMAVNAQEQQEGEWTMFGVSLAGIGFSFVALTTELADARNVPSVDRTLHVVLVATTLLVSWLVTHVVFALRYAHEYYTRSPGGTTVDGGLIFPGDETPDYWDFLYFSLVLGMTFQVSDVQIASRKLRRLATLHGFIGFVDNTVIIGLTVNIMAGLL